MMGIYSDTRCQVMRNSSEGWGWVQERYFEGEPEQLEGRESGSRGIAVLEDKTVETRNSFQQMAQDTASPSLSLLGLLMPPRVPAGVAITDMSQNAFRTRGYTASKLQEPTAKLGSTTASEHQHSLHFLLASVSCNHYELHLSHGIPCGISRENL